MSVLLETEYSSEYIIERLCSTHSTEYIVEMVMKYKSLQRDTSLLVDKVVQLIELGEENDV